MATLESCKLFDGLAPAELRQLCAVACELHFPAGREIFAEGAAGDGLYVVRSGLVQISGQVTGGGRYVFAKIPPGEIFGEMAIIDDQPRSACALAEEDTQVYFIPREPVRAVLSGSAALSFEMMRATSHRLRQFNQLHLRELIQSERMALVGRFASSIVHDLKNPLTIIGMAADLAALDNATLEARRTAQQRIRKQVERINDLVSDILEFTRGPGTPPARAALDYAGFVENVVQEIEYEVVLKGVAVKFLNPPPAVKLLLNPQRMNRVFHNLMFNAVDIMPDGGSIHLQFSLTPTEVITEIEDTGPGIALEVMPRLFEAFATFGKPRGTGLGLSIARRIIEEHGGRIYARNQFNGGALFGFSLPLLASGTTGLP